jgi:pilus assembly protein FimV
MNRSLKLSMLMALALGSSQAVALDLGQIQVKSALGQPLLAEIPLHPASPAELKNLTVQLASSEDFVRAGIASGRTSIPLQFRIATAADGQQVIRITSSVAVDDPYLDLLLQMNGSAGKSVREFTILLDPPGTSGTEAVAVAQSRVTRRSEPVVPRRPAAAAIPAPKSKHAATATATAATTASSSNGQYGPVTHGQTLSEIARSTAPAGVDVHQMLVALKQVNPDAFYRDNINALKSGVVLRVPTSAEAQAMEVAAAVAEVRRENSDWRTGATRKPGVVADAATRTPRSTSSSAKPDNTGDRLALVPAKEGNDNGAQGSRAGGGSDKSADSAHQDLLRSRESLASLQQQSTDLKTRLKDLTDINSKNERLLSLKDNEIAELQNKLAAARKAAGTPAAAAPIATAASVAAVKPAVAATAPSRPITSIPAASVATATASTNAAAAPSSSTSTARLAPAAALSATTAPASTPVVAVNKPVPVKPAAKPAYRPAPMPAADDPWYMQTWAWAAGAGAVLLLILLAMLGRRRKSAPATGSSSSLADRFGPAAAAGHDTADSDDVDQDELLDQLAEHPDDLDLHLELVALYYSRRDVERFEAAAEAMHAHITDPQQDEWQDVLHMGEDLAPGHPLFDHHPELPAHEETEARRAFDIDDYANGDDALAANPPPLPSAPKKVSEYNFNFDLTSAAAQAAVDADKAAAPAPDALADLPVVAAGEAASSWKFDDAESSHHATGHDHDAGEFNDDPVDTKLDLARAYLDMGDADGARAMLGEVLKEGSQPQQDVAKRLLEGLN